MSPTSMIVTLAFAALLAIAAVRWQRTFVMSLPFLAILSGVSVRVFGPSMRLDQVVGCLLVVPLAASTLIGARKLRVDATTWWLGAILVLNVLASAMNSPARAYSLAQCVNLASAWVVYVLLLNFLETREDLDAFFERTLWAAVLASVVGIVAFALAVVGLDVGGAEVSTSAARRLTAAYGAYGTMVEPNILGGFAAAYLVLAAGLLALAPQSVDVVKYRRLLAWVVGCTGVVLILTFTRAAWVAAMAGLGVIVMLRMRRRPESVRARRMLGPALIVLVLVGALLMAPGDAGTLFRFKLFNLLNLETQTAVVRVVSYALALDQWLAHPVIGWGTFTFAPLVAQGTDFQQFDNWRNLWIGNYLLLALHDTGLLGLACWIAMLAGMLKRAWTTIKTLKIVDADAASRVRAMTLATCTLLVAFLATSGFSLGYTWVLLGLLGAHARLVAAEQPVAERAHDPVATDAVPI